MKPTLLITAFALVQLNLFASHIVGGEMFYDCLGGNEYKVTIKLYRDCYSDGAAYDANLPVTVFNGSGAQIDHFTISFPGSVVLPVTFNNPCVTIPPDICVEEAIYTKTVTLPASTNGYKLSYQRCCRGPNVTNLSAPDDQGITLMCEIPPSNQAACNSSARFNNFPPLLLCAGEELIFDHSATDPDGDVLVYELCAPFHGGSSLDPAPDPASAPPYPTVTYASGITPVNPFGNGTITIDSNTGLLSATPQQPGLYVVGVCVKEYRAGILISTTRRDFLFTVFDCEITMEAEVTPQIELSTFVSYCEGLTIDFENESYGGTNYLWDFGVQGITSDVSTDFAPSYTYPGPGTYEVMLVVNPGWTCTDTSIETFIVQNSIDAEFEAPPPQCITDNSYDFTGTGTFPATGTTFQWDFGPANPTTSSDQNPSGVVFTEPGFHPVTFTVYYDVCHVSHTDTVIVHGHPSILFSIDDELKCAPYRAEFINFSTSTAPLHYYWEFGDGIGTSDQQHPIYIYENPGVYDVTLTIWTTEGCIDTLTLERPNLIQVFPAPISDFTVDPPEQDEYHADFYFTDQSQDAAEVWYHFGDGYTGEGPNTWHNYQEPGVYHPWQVVTNEYGCQDISYQQLTVTPVIPVLVPNAFTPDGDHVNNIFKPVWYDEIPFKMWIYNRWGELVHYTDVVGGYWDGTNANGELVPDGLYIWRIEYLEYDTELPVEITGHVMVLK